MADRRAINLAMRDDRAQEAEEIALLSLKTSTICFLTLEDTLGDLHNKYDRMLENFEILNRRIDEPPVLPPIEANGLNENNFSD